MKVRDMQCILANYAPDCDIKVFVAEETFPVADEFHTTYGGSQIHTVLFRVDTRKIICMLDVAEYEAIEKLREVTP